MATIGKPPYYVGLSTLHPDTGRIAEPDDPAYRRVQLASLDEIVFPTASRAYEFLAYFVTDSGGRMIVPPTRIVLDEV